LALNKRKVLDAARKFAQKGAQEKALKEYAKLLKADSRDAKLLLEIGDAHRRWGQNEEAISHYIRVAEQYKQGGFDARAVAVFRQILNLDGKRYPAYVSLAELYQRMGLDGEAVHALQTAADGYHKEGQKHEALELLRKMATLDPTNTTSRMKVAELLRQEELFGDAISEYEAVIEELVRQGANDALIPVYERILEISPERADIEFALARNLIQLSQSDRAEPYARRAFDHKPDAEGHFDLLTGIYTELGKTAELTQVTKTMAQVCRDRGDEDQARELMQRLPSGDVFVLPEDAAGQAPGEVSATDQDGLLDDDFLDDDFLAADDGTENADDSFIDVGGDEDLELDLGGDDQGDEAQADLDGSSASDVSPPEGDPDQLFAEASVYLRYAKRDQAIASLEAILVQEPDHRDALEKIGEFHADAGDSSKAVEYWIKTATLAQHAGDEVAVDALRERIAVLDPDAAAALAAAPPEGSPPEVDAAACDAIASNPDVDGDLDLDLEMELGEDENAASGEGSDELDEMVLDDSLDDSIDVSAFVESSDGENTVIELDEASGPVAGATASSSPGEPVAASSTQSQKIAEDLEEAEFYMEQELFDEAEAVYNRVLEIVPSHPSAMLRLGELRAARGEDPSASAVAVASLSDATLDPADLPFDESDVSEGDGFESQTSDEDASVDLGENSELEIAAEIDFEEDAEADAGADAAGDDDEDAEIAIEVEVEVDVELADDDAPRLDDDSTPDVDSGEIEIDEQALGPDEEDAESPFDAPNVTDSDVPSDAGEDHEVEIELDDDASEEEQVLETPTADNTMPLCTETEGAVAAEEVDAAAPPIAAQADPDDSFDLAAELRECLDDEDERAEQGDASAAGESTSEDEGFASIFKDFKSGVEKTLAENDYETRFDLGIAYRGMELFDDALGEFCLCLDSPGHRLESLHMMGLCAIDLGRFADASNHFEQALASEDVPLQKQAGLRFDLGRSFECLGDDARAKEAFEAAKAADATIPGIDDCIARVTERIGSGADPVELDDTSAGTDGFENFDDLVAEVEADEGPDETFESFDDVVAEVEASDVTGKDSEAPNSAEEDRSEAQAEVVAEQDSEPSASQGGAKKRKKKKRISFV
jgi:tetratricopeptide (TPR) repeat protein